MQTNTTPPIDFPDKFPVNIKIQGQDWVMVKATVLERMEKHSTYNYEYYVEKWKEQDAKHEVELINLRNTEARLTQEKKELRQALDDAANEAFRLSNELKEAKNTAEEVAIITTDKIKTLIEANEQLQAKLDATDEHGHNKDELVTIWKNHFKRLHENVVQYINFGECLKTESQSQYNFKSLTD